MSNQPTTMARPVHLAFPPSPPPPAADCDVCKALARQRTEARSRGDYSAETDRSVEIAAHSKEHPW